FITPPLIKKLIVFTLLTISASTLSAQHYRGFVDAYGPVSINGLPSGFSDEAPKLGIGGMTSHGVQIRKLFVGAGAGYIYSEPTHTIPVFADVRWDFFGNRGVNPFVGLRLGYTAVLDPANYDREVYYRDSEHTCTYRESNEASFYFQPTVGLRIRTAPKCGLNISLSYIPIKNVIKDYHYYTDSDWNSTETIKSYTKGYLALGLGFDF
ncbi:MAG: hypothetical protein K2L69_09260, partial [Muribaculaceae bacterium]|nr:hypothetical protein [Muribaculaceae bacterium]